MKNVIATETIEQKKQRLANELLVLRDKWPYSEKAMWCITNAYNTDAITRGYLRGSITSIPVAEAIIKAIKEYMAANGIAA